MRVAAAVLVAFALTLSSSSSSSPRLFLHVGGRGTHRLVLLHGLGATGRYFADRARPIENDHVVVAPDLLGFGSSPWPRDARYDLADHVAALEASLPNERALLVGHSFGAIVALALAARHPERYAGVVVIALPVFRDAVDAEEHMRRMGAMERGILDDAPLWRALAALNPVIATLHAGALVGLPDDVYVDSTRHSWDALVRSMRHVVIETDVGALARQVEREHVPILFIHGARDQTAPAKNALELAHAIGASSVVLDDDHALFLHDPTRVWNEIRRFESQLPAR